MINKIIACVAACLLAAVSQTAHADDAFESACRPPKIVLAHINGIQTPEEEAQDQLKKNIQVLVQDR